MLTDQNFEAELSYAYLHAVATRVGFSCEYRNRHLDGAGVDATVTEDGRMLASAVYRGVADGLSGRRGASLMAFAGASGL